MFWPFKTISADLLIYDDIFPSELSPFRYTEYMAYLAYFKHIHILCSGKSLNLVSQSSDIKKLLNQFDTTYPQYQGKLSIYHPWTKLKAKLIYVTFICNAQYLKLSTLKIPFVLQVYPGGGLQVKNPSLENEMKRIFNSPYCKKIIITQHYLYDYILKHSLCPKEKIAFIFGVVTPPSLLTSSIVEKRYFGINKKTLDISFTAHKYMPFGKDKGYDIFIKCAKLLVKKYDFIRFHIVGNYSEEDIDVSDLKGKIFFYGVQKSDFFSSFYKDIDILISPNRPFTLSKGSFDGFPTAAATEAGLHGVTLFVSDELKENKSFFNEGREIIIIKPNAEDIIRKIELLVFTPMKIKEIGIAGSKKIKQLYSTQAQIDSRIKLLEKLL